MPLSTTLAEAKGFLRVADAAEDALVTLLIDAAEAKRRRRHRRWSSPRPVPPRCGWPC
jgi:hypothetical protein